MSNHNQTLGGDGGGHDGPIHRATQQGAGGASDAVSEIRSEERLTAATESVAVATARLEKYLVHEDRTITVRVYREEVRLVFDNPRVDTPVSTTDVSSPATPLPADVAAIAVTDTVVLYAEQPVISTTWVPVETARLQVRTVTGSQTVTDVVNVEHVDTDIGTTGPRGGDQW